MPACAGMTEEVAGGSFPRKRESSSRTRGDFGITFRLLIVSIVFPRKSMSKQDALCYVVAAWHKNVKRATFSGGHYGVGYHSFRERRAGRFSHSRPSGFFECG